MARPQDATACLEEASRLVPDRAGVWCRLGATRALAGRFDEAEAAFERAQELDANLVDVRFQRGRLRLLRGDWARGREDLRAGTMPPGSFALALESKLWNGEPQHGKVILLHSDLGPAATMLMARYVPLVQQRGLRVILTCHPLLVRLLERYPAIDRVLTDGQVCPTFDLQAPLSHLPAIFATDEASTPPPPPGIECDPRDVERWAAEVDPDAVRVGLCWQSDLPGALGRIGSIPLAALESILNIDGVQFYGLQPGPAAEALASSPFVERVVNLASRARDFADVAAQLVNLDLVIACDGTVAHLAGALNVPSCVLLPTVPDWTWMLERDDSPWYPNMRLFRQEDPGQWDEILERIASGLKTLVAQNSAATGIGST